MRSVRIRIVFACGLSVLAAASAGQQVPSQLPPTFRAGVDAVQLDVSVLDKDRRPVRGLTALRRASLRHERERRLAVTARTAKRV